MEERRRKRLTGRKVASYLINIITYIAMFFVTLFKAPEILNVIGTIIIIAILLNGAIFVGGNTLDKITSIKYLDKINKE